jgi:hypothetical protein
MVRVDTLLELVDELCAEIDPKDARSGVNAYCSLKLSHSSIVTDML